MDAARRKTQVARMQQIFYEQAPYAVLYYPKALIAYNTAKWDGWVPYPNADGLPVMAGDNVDSYVQIHPKAATTTTSSSSSSTRWIVIAVGVVIVIVVVGLLVLRRGRGKALTE
jgi:hypothetical protein